MRGLIRRLFIVVLLLATISVFVWRSAQGAEDPIAKEAAQRKAYADSVRQTYGYRFGKCNPSGKCSLAYLHRTGGSAAASVKPTAPSIGGQP